MSGFHATAEEATGSIADEGELAAFYAAAQSSVVDTVYLVRLFPGHQLAAPGDGIEPTASVATASLPDDEGGAIEVVELPYSDRGWISAAGDVPAHTSFAARAEVPIRIERSVPLSPEEDRRIAVQFGGVELINADGLLDEIVANYAIDGRRVLIQFGAITDALADFGTVADVSAIGWTANDDTVTVEVRDNGFLLEVPIQSNFYLGTGGAEGAAENKDKPKPLLYGPCDNVTPVLINPSLRIYQVHDGPVQQFVGVYDRGAALTFSADYADYAALAAASISAGQYATCKALGLLRVQSQPEFLTADVKGDASGTGYVADAAAIMLRIVRERLAIDVSYVNVGAFQSLTAAQPAPVCIYITEPRQTPDVLDELALSIGAWHGCGRDGRITVDRIAAPDPSPDIRLEEADILALRRVASPAAIYPPCWRRTVAYRRNWTPMTDDQIAGSVSDARRQFLLTEYRVTAAADATVQNLYLLAQDPPPIPSLIYEEADATAEVERLLDLYKVERHLFEVDIKTVGHTVQLGNTALIGWPRYGLGNGALCVIRGIDEDAAERKVTLTVWGRAA